MAELAMERRPALPVHMPDELLSPWSGLCCSAMYPDMTIASSFLATRAFTTSPRELFSVLEKFDWPA